MSKYAKIGDIYKFCKIDLLYCVKIAKIRHDNNIRQHSKNLNYSGRNDYDINLQGVLGEYAFIKMFPQDYDFLEDTDCKNVLNDIFDAKLQNGWSVDVKTTVKKNANLLVSSNKLQNPADVYALLILDFIDGNLFSQNNYFQHDEDALNSLYDNVTYPTIVYKGMIHGTHVFETENQINFYNKVFYSVDTNKLQDYLNVYANHKNPLIVLFSSKPKPTDF